MHRLRKVPKRVEGGTVLNAPWVVLALVANTAMRPFSFPVFSFSSSLLRRRPLSPPVDFYVMVYLPLSWCSGSKNPQGRLRRKQRAVVPNVDFTSSAVCRLESTRDGSSKMALPLKKFYSCYTFGCCGRRRRREMMTLQCIAAKDRAQTT